MLKLFTHSPLAYIWRHTTDRRSKVYLATLAISFVLVAQGFVVLAIQGRKIVAESDARIAEAVRLLKANNIQVPKFLQLVGS